MPTRFEPGYQKTNDRCQLAPKILSTGPELSSHQMFAGLGVGTLGHVQQMDEGKLGA